MGCHQLCIMTFQAIGSGSGLLVRSVPDVLGDGLDGGGPEVVQPLLQGHQGLRCQGVEIPGADRMAVDQPGSLQDPQMFADRRTADGQEIGEPADRERTTLQLPEDLPPLRLTQRVECGLGRTMVTHEQRSR